MGQLADSRVCLHVAMYFSPTIPFLANTEFTGAQKPLLHNAPARSLQSGDIIFFCKMMHPRDLFFSTDEIGCYLCRGLGGYVAVAPTMFMCRLWTGRLSHQGFQKQKRISFCCCSEDLGHAVCLIYWRIVLLWAPSSRDVSTEDSREWIWTMSATGLCLQDEQLLPASCPPIKESSISLQSVLWLKGHRFCH